MPLDLRVECFYRNGHQYALARPYVKAPAVQGARDFSVVDHPFAERTVSVRARVVHSMELTVQIKHSYLNAVYVHDLAVTGLDVVYTARLYKCHKYHFIGMFLSSFVFCH